MSNTVQHNDIIDNISESKSIEGELRKSTCDEKLTRLQKAFDVLGLPNRGRVKDVAEKINISRGMVSRFLSGRDPLSKNFIKLVSERFGISAEYINFGHGDMLTKLISISAQAGTVSFRESIIETILSFFNDALISASQGDILRLYADLLESERLELIKKDGGKIVFNNPKAKK